MPNYRYALSICLLFLLATFYYSMPLIKEETFRTPREEVVLFAATPYFGVPLDKRFLATCTEEEKKFCRVSTNPEDHSKAAAVLFHSRDFALDPLPRRKDQVYVWWTQESPIHEKIQVPPDYINWTMSHWKESDIWYPYNRMRPLEKEATVDWDAIWNNKTKTSAWVASNCATENRRLDIVKTLAAKGLDLDIFGACGKPLPGCPRNAGPWCAVNLLRTYKFYVTMENSNCPDYISEKFWTSLTHFMAVPIVMKRSYYTKYGIPPSAFIALDDFPDFKGMITYIENVSTNRTLYMKHHNWRTEHRVQLDAATGLCDLCRRLKTNNFAPKSYKDLSAWFSKSTCDQKLYEKYL